MTPQEALDLITAFYIQDVRSRGREPSIDQQTTDNLIELANYITSDVPKFGVMFCGLYGNGKTTMMRALQQCVYYLDKRNHFSFLDDEYYCTRFKPRFPIVSVKDVVGAMQDNMNEYQKYKQSNMLGLDDLGNEPAEVMAYGNLLSPIVDLLEFRYNNQLFTVISSNLDAKNIREKYGPRIADRFNEMVHKIVFRNASYRR